MHTSVENGRSSPTDSSSRETEISLVLPAWNEAEGIVRSISEAREALSTLCDDFEIIVVDDGSTDATAELVSRESNLDPRVRLIRHDGNLGYGAALRNGFQAATKELVAFTDSDCQFDLNELDRFVLLSKDYDIVCGYRIDRKDTPLRCLYSRGYNQLVRLLLGTTVRDIDCALKLFHRDVVQQLKITTDGFLVNSELLTQAKHRGHSVVEVGVSHRPRIEGESTVSIHHIPKVLESLVRYWWNAVQFPATRSPMSTTRDSSTGLSKTDRSLGWCQIALMLFAALFVLINLSYPLIDRSETRYAEISREMMVTGNWIAPRLNFEPYYDKPPLLFWMSAASFSVFGISEWSARLPAALASLLSLAATLWFGSRWFGRRVGLYSGLVLMLSAGFIFCSRYLLIDGVLTSLVTLSLFTAYEAMRGDRLKLRWWLLSAVCCGLGFLAKGPIAIVLWLPPVFAFAWLTQNHARPQLKHYLAHFGTVAAVAAPWFLLIHLQDPRFIPEFFIRHNVHRFAGGFHSKPFWFFLPVLLVAGHPWSFLTVPLTRFLVGRREEYRENRPPILGFLLLWSGWCFLFFSFSKGKLPTYLLPATPALALVVGYYLQLAIRHANVPTFRHARFWSAKAATITTCFVALAFLIFGLGTELNVPLSTYAWAMVWTMILVGTVLLFQEDRNLKSTWITSAISAGLLGIMVMHQLVPAYSRSQTLLGNGSPFQRSIASDAPVATVTNEFAEVPYYLQRSDVRHWSNVSMTGLSEFVEQHEESVLVVSKNLSIDRLKTHLPEGVSTQLIGERGPAKVIRVVLDPQSTRVAERKTGIQTGTTQR